MDDDAKTAALGERWFGAGKGRSSLLYVSLRVGVGSGLIVNDEAYRGHYDSAAEIGRTTLNVNSPRRPCGNRGCVETLVGVPAILESARRCGLADSLVELFDPAGSAAQPALRDEVLSYLVAMIVNAVNHFDPELIVYGGPLVRARPNLVEQLRRAFNAACPVSPAMNLAVMPPCWGRDTSALAMVCLAVNPIVLDLLNSRGNAGPTGAWIEIAGLTRIRRDAVAPVVTSP